ncbi:MAG: UDP-N-acetyl-D-mannosaminuronic acid transferase [Pirellulaceae bacterium]|nr:MAG: UDP-N-acetyl-D-mannosaminuronic acid transferase [Pirellulaceae bacterium]
MAMCNDPHRSSSVACSFPDLQVSYGDTAGDTAHDDSSQDEGSRRPARIALPPQVPVWGTSFARLNMEETLRLAAQIIQLREPEYFITANLNYLMLTRRYPRLHEINERAAAVLADGFPIVVRSRMTPTPLPGRVTGADLVVRLAALAHHHAWRIYFLGGAPGVADAAARRLQRQYPGMQIAGRSAPPFRKISSAEHAAMLDEIRRAEPDILLVAFGQPKGEFWIYDHFRELGVPLSIQIGASFDFLVGTAKRAPLAMQRLNLEWLYRALSEPRRLGPRYLRNAMHLGFLLANDALNCLRGRRQRSVTR